MVFTYLFCCALIWFFICTWVSLLLHFLYLACWKYSLMPLIDWSLVLSRSVSGNKPWKEGLHITPLDGQVEVRTKGSRGSILTPPYLPAMLLNSIKLSYPKPPKLQPPALSSLTLMQLNQFHNVCLYTAAQTAAGPQGRQWHGTVVCTSSRNTYVYLGGKATCK